MTNVQIDPAVDTTRRQWLQALAAAPLVASATAPKSAKAAIKTSARIVIAGSGLGGIAVANRLTQLLDGGKITIIDRKEEHNYQPGYTLVASGVWPVSKVRDRNADFLPAGIEWVKDMVAHFDPVARHRRHSERATHPLRLSGGGHRRALGLCADYRHGCVCHWTRRSDQRLPQPRGRSGHLGSHADFYRPRWQCRDDATRHTAQMRWCAPEDDLHAT